MVEHYIGGEWVASRTTFETISPIDEQVIDEVARADAGDVDRAVNAAHDAFPGWAALGPAGRAEHLHALADLIDANLERLAIVECTDMAMLLRSLRARVIARGASNFRAYADLAVAYEERDWRSRGTWNRVQRMPSGVFNVLQGHGQEAGAALVRHPLLRRVSFTGSPETGRSIGEAAARNIVPFTAELGGKNPFVVFADADLDAAGRKAAGQYDDSGQVCLSGTRILVEAGVRDEFLERFHAAAGEHVLGDPRDDATTISPMIHPDHVAR